MKSYRLPLLVAAAVMLSFVAHRVQLDPALRDFVDPREQITTGLAFAALIGGPITLIWLEWAKVRGAKSKQLPSDPQTREGFKEE